MKTFRLIGMALLAVMMCVNFVSCGDDDEEPIKNEDGIVTNEKKLVQITRNEYGGTDTWDFFYDSKGRLSKVIYNGTNIDEYIWGDNTIIVPNSHTGTLSNNLMRNIVFHKNKYVTKYEYNSSKQLTKVQSDDMGEYTITWENGKIVKIDNCEFIYSGKTCKGYNPLFIRECGIHEEDLFYAHPELAGCRCTQLPDKTIINREGTTGYKTIEYTYKFDNDGYLLSCHEMESGYTKGWSGQCTYFFKWE